MPSITTIDKAAAKRISDAAVEALRPVAEELGLTLEAKGGSYDPTAGTYSPKLVFALADSARRAFEHDCGYVWPDGTPDGPRLEPSDYGATFVSQGRTFELVGVNLRAPKFPLLAKDVADGRTYKFKSSAVALVVAGRAGR